MRNPLLLLATLVAVYAFRNRRAKSRLAGVGPGDPVTLRCSVRRTYDSGRPTPWIEGEIHLTKDELPIWIASPEQANTRIVLDLSTYTRLVADRAAETVLADVVTLVADGVLIEVALTAAEAEILAPLFDEAPRGGD